MRILPGAFAVIERTYFFYGTDGLFPLTGGLIKGE